MNRSCQLLKQRRAAYAFYNLFKRYICNWTWNQIFFQSKDSYSAVNFCFKKGLCMIWNNGTLSEHKSHLSCHNLGFQSSNRYESDLSNEVLYILVDQEAAKISEVKVRIRKKICRISGPRGHQSRIWLSRQFCINLQLWPLVFSQPLDLQGCTVPHLKDLIHICLETESQVHGMIFNVIYVRSNYPYFISYRGLC